MWAAEMLGLVGSEGGRSMNIATGVSTLGRDISWDPDGSGRAVDICRDPGPLIEDDSGGAIEIHSGAVRHVRG